MENRIKQSFLLLGISTLGVLAAPQFLSAKEKAQQKPNIIYIFTDQQSANMMSCAGNEWLKTPAMDYIATNGIRFTRAYTTNPVCAPARISLMTGRFPGAFKDNKGNQVRENVGAVRVPEVSDEILQTTLPAFLKKAGYDLIYGGKEHLPKPLIPVNLGFTDITNNERDELAQKAAEYIREKHEKPYFMVVSLINPHDICYMAIRDFASTEQDKNILRNGKVEISTLDKAMAKPEGVSDEEFYAHYCPTLPANLEPQQDEPKAVFSLIDRRPFRKNARAHYTGKNWRMHRWAYCRLTEVVDNEINQILGALRESGQEESTLVLFASDHGDMNAAHRMEHKTALYEEATNIPFMAMWKGVIPAGRVDSVHLVSSGLDLLPTVCDYAGVNGKSDPRSKSLRPLLEGTSTNWRKTLGVESEIGRMVVGENGCKYIRYDAGGAEVRLHDLKADPGEMTHFETNPAYKSKLTQLKKAFEQQWFPGF